MGSDMKKGSFIRLPLIDDMLIEIFARLPAKSTLRFRCVSRAWLRLLSDPSVAKRLRLTMSGFFYRPRPRPFDRLLYESVYPNNDHQFDMEAFKDMMLVDSCNGLLLFWVVRGGGGDMVIANPTANTRLSFSMNVGCPQPDAIFKRIKLAYFPLISPHFAIVLCFWHWNPPRVFLRVFYSDTSDYLEIEIRETVFEWGHEIFDLVGGSLYMDAIDGLSRSFIRVGIIAAGKHQVKVVRISMPPDPITDGFPFRLFGESEGSCHYARAHRSKLLIWMRNGSNWVLKHSINTRPFAMHSRLWSTPSLPSISPVAFHTDLDVIFLQFESRIYACHAPTNKFEEMACGEEVVTDYSGHPIKPYKHCLVDPLQEMDSIIKSAKSPKTRKIRLLARNPSNARKTG